MINIEMFKRKIINLAFKGQLITNFKSYENCDEFLKETKKEQHRLADIGEVKKEKKASTIEETISDFELPLNWKLVRLDQFCTDIFSGKSPKYERQKTEFRIIGQAANKPKAIDYSFIKYTNEDFWNSNEKKLFLRKGDVLLNTLGTGTIGRSGFINELPFPLLTDGHPFVFRTINYFSSKFLFYFLQLKRNDIEQKANGSTNQAFLNLSNTRKWLIPCPPLNEQKEIVIKLDEIFAELDKVETSQNELVDIQNKLQSKVLQLAIQGKLVEQRSEEGTAVELLKTLGVTNINQNETDDMPFQIPESWVWCKLSDIGTTNIGLTYHPEDIVDNGIMVIRSSNIIDGQLDYKDKVCVNCPIKPSQYLNDTNIVICSRNGSKNLVGKNAIYRGKNNVYSFGAFMAIFRTQFYEYVHLYFNSDAFKRYFNSDDSKQINQVTQAILKDSLIPLPPLKEQIRIVEKYNELISAIKSI